MYQSELISSSKRCASQEHQGRSALVRLRQVSWYVTQLGARRDDTCCICLDRMQPRQHRVLALACGHAFHEPCITQWLAAQALCQCPLCKRSY
jgi:hypothetical protein